MASYRPIPSPTAAPKTGCEEVHLDEKPTRDRRPLGQKELAQIFDLDPRHIRRLQKDGLVIPQRRKGSVRIACYAEEEVARFAAYRFRRGKGFCSLAAERLGWLDFLNTVEAAVTKEANANDPGRFAGIRPRLRIELLVLGEQSPLAAQLGLTATEIDHEAVAARSLVSELLLTQPHIAHALAEVIQDGLSAQAISRGKAAGEKKKDFGPAAFGAIGTGSVEPALVPKIQCPPARKARVSGGKAACSKS
jgi:hypothetical protein